MKTYAAKASEIQREWRVVDADGATLGRVATRPSVAPSASTTRHSRWISLAFAAYVFIVAPRLTYSSFSLSSSRFARSPYVTRMRHRPCAAALGPACDRSRDPRISPNRAALIL